MTNDTIDHKSIQSTAYLSVYHPLDDTDFLLPAISFSSMVVGKLTKCNVSSSLRTSTGGPCGASDTHTHTAKWANFPRPNAASPSPSSSPSPIGFFYASKFLVSQPATIWSVVVLNSRLGQGSKTGTRWWRGGWRWKTELNWTEKLHWQFEFFLVFVVSHFRKFVVCPVQGFLILGGCNFCSYFCCCCYCCCTKLRQRSGNE